MVVPHRKAHRLDQLERLVVGVALLEVSHGGGAPVSARLPTSPSQHSRQLRLTCSYLYKFFLASGTDENSLACAFCQWSWNSSSETPSFLRRSCMMRTRSVRYAELPKTGSDMLLGMDDVGGAGCAEVVLARGGEGKKQERAG